MQPRWRTILTLGLVAVLLVPLVRTGDGVPLSSYPMYSRPRPVDIAFIVPSGLRDNGAPAALSPDTIAGTADPLIVESYLRREVEGGRVDSLCAAIASRVRDADIVRVEIRSEEHDVVDWVLNHGAPLASQLLTSCAVP